MKAKHVLIGPIRHLIMAGLYPVEKNLLRKSKTIRGTVCCFVIGPPRSGTTLVYELMIRRFGFSYISNLAHRFYLTPLAVTKFGYGLIRKWRKNNRKQYQSRYGALKGWGAPNEGGWIWNQWFPQDYYLDESHIVHVPVKKIRATIFGLSAIMGNSFISKNVMHSVHMGLLDRLFPNCLFIHVRRNMRANIRSIVRAQLAGTTVSTNQDEWWSVKPLQWKSYAANDLVTRSWAQVYHLHENIDKQAKVIGPNRVKKVNYEDVCRDPKTALGKIEIFLERHKTHFSLSDNIPPHFKLGGQFRLSPERESKIKSLVKNFRY